jgi:hypothetical protein
MGLKMSDLITDKQRLFDLLVDGELAENERGELLAWCEREPDGWRRCALAFLEAQSWSKVLGGLTETTQRPAIGQQSPTTTVARPDRFWHERQWGTMLAMAASVVLAFTLGVWVRNAGTGGQIVPLGQPVTSIVGNGASGADQGHLPGVAGDQLDGDWLRMQPAAVPEDVRRAFERLGHQVEQQRRLVPYRLDDGRRIVVPVDQVEVRPVENRSYQ